MTLDSSRGDGVGGGAGPTDPGVLTEKNLTNVSLSFTELTALLRHRTHNSLVQEATRLMARPPRGSGGSSSGSALVRGDHARDADADVDDSDGILALPTDCLMRVVCCLRHDELQPLLATCQLLREVPSTLNPEPYILNHPHMQILTPIPQTLKPEA